MVPREEARVHVLDSAVQGGDAVRGAAPADFVAGFGAAPGAAAGALAPGAVKAEKVCVIRTGLKISVKAMMEDCAPCSSPCALGGVRFDVNVLIAGMATPARAEKAIIA